MSTQNRTKTSTWNHTPFGRLAARSSVPGCRRPSLAEALCEVANRLSHFRCTPSGRRPPLPPARRVRKHFRTGTEAGRLSAG